ncbi:hypothetical protein D3H65_09505 [Paraflavitalea soli]|uniref:Outer membrane protein beta-barrel domain-containing protein n=2 Tax=Paraflavitalea soli TaxID=2315862 RepID=A0A3B7MRF5_9BACT|nr:hypothetical protein D3H65_09505 [Paraflavitalea soli]
MLPSYRQFNHGADTNHLQKKWFLTKYAGISAGFAGFSGGSASFLSAPMGLQINRQLTNNVYAFAGVSVAPVFAHYNSPFYQPGAIKNYGLMNPNNNFGTYSAAHMGLMYINNDKTFSISGSIGVGRHSYNGYSPFYAPGNNGNTPMPRNLQH